MIFFQLLVVGLIDMILLLSLVCNIAIIINEKLNKSTKVKQADKQIITLFIVEAQKEKRRKTRKTID